MAHDEHQPPRDATAPPGAGANERPQGQFNGDELEFEPFMYDQGDGANLVKLGASDPSGVEPAAVLPAGEQIAPFDPSTLDAGAGSARATATIIRDSPQISLAPAPAEPIQLEGGEVPIPTYLKEGAPTTTEAPDAPPQPITPLDTSAPRGQGRQRTSHKSGPLEGRSAAKNAPQAPAEQGAAEASPEIDRLASIFESPVSLGSQAGAADEPHPRLEPLAWASLVGSDEEEQEPLPGGWTESALASIEDFSRVLMSMRENRQPAIVAPELAAITTGGPFGPAIPPGAEENPLPDWAVQAAAVGKIKPLPKRSRRAAEPAAQPQEPQPSRPAEQVATLAEQPSAPSPAEAQPPAPTAPVAEQPPTPSLEAAATPAAPPVEERIEAPASAAPEATAATGQPTAPTPPSGPEEARDWSHGRIEPDWEATLDTEAAQSVSREIGLDEQSSPLGPPEISEILERYDEESLRAVTEGSLTGDNLEFESYMFNEGAAGRLPEMPALQGTAQPARTPEPEVVPTAESEEAPLPFWLVDTGEMAAALEAEEVTTEPAAPPMSQPVAAVQAPQPSPASAWEDFADLPPIEPFDFSALQVPTEEEEKLGFDPSELLVNAPTETGPMAVTADLTALANELGNELPPELAGLQAHQPSARASRSPAAAPHVEAPSDSEDEADSNSSTRSTTPLGTLPDEVAAPPQSDAAPLPPWTAPAELEAEYEAQTQAMAEPLEEPVSPLDTQVVAEEPSTDEAPAPAGEEEREFSWTAHATNALPLEAEALPNELAALREPPIPQPSPAAEEPVSPQGEEAQLQPPAGNRLATDEDLGIAPFDYTQLDLEEDEIPTEHLDRTVDDKAASTLQLDTRTEANGATPLDTRPAPSPQDAPWTETEPDTGLISASQIGEELFGLPAEQAEGGPVPVPNMQQPVPQDEVQLGQPGPAGEVFRARVAWGGWTARKTLALADLELLSGATASEAHPGAPANSYGYEAAGQQQMVAQGEGVPTVSAVQHDAFILGVPQLIPQPEGNIAVRLSGSQISGPLPTLEGFEELYDMAAGNPEDLGAQMALAAAYTNSSQAEHALRVYRRLLKRRKISPAVVQLIADELADLEDEVGHLPRFHQVVGDLFVKQGRFQEAIEEYNRAL